MEKILGHTFKDKALLTIALTHSSFHPKCNYERLEFLGDRVLNMCVADILYQEFSAASEGELAKRHAALVKEPTLAFLAKHLGVGAHIKLGPSEISSKGHEKPSLLADVMESTLGALYLDAGYATAQNFVKKHWAPLLNAVQLQDGKTKLQELLQSQQFPLPTYIVVDEQGKDNNKVFTISVSSSLGSAEGTGTSKQTASQAAAEALLLKISSKL